MAQTLTLSDAEDPAQQSIATRMEFFTLAREELGACCRTVMANKATNPYRDRKPHETVPDNEEMNGAQSGGSRQGVDCISWVFAQSLPAGADPDIIGPCQPLQGHLAPPGRRAHDEGRLLRLATAPHLGPRPATLPAALAEEATAIAATIMERPVRPKMVPEGALILVQLDRRAARDALVGRLVAAFEELERRNDGVTVRSSGSSGTPTRTATPATPSSFVPFSRRPGSWSPRLGSRATPPPASRSS